MDINNEWGRREREERGEREEAQYSLPFLEMMVHGCKFSEAKLSGSMMMLLPLWPTLITRRWQRDLVLQVLKFSYFNEYCYFLSAFLKLTKLSLQVFW